MIYTSLMDKVWTTPAPLDIPGLCLPARLRALPWRTHRLPLGCRRCSNVVIAAVGEAWPWLLRGVGQAQS